MTLFWLRFWILLLTGDSVGIFSFVIKPAPEAEQAKSGAEQAKSGAEQAKSGAEQAKPWSKQVIPGAKHIVPQPGIKGQWLNAGQGPIVPNPGSPLDASSSPLFDPSPHQFRPQNLQTHNIDVSGFEIAKSELSRTEGHWSQPQGHTQRRLADDKQFKVTPNQLLEFGSSPPRSSPGHVTHLHPGHVTHLHPGHVTHVHPGHVTRSHLGHLHPGDLGNRHVTRPHPGQSVRKLHPTSKNEFGEAEPRNVKEQ
jgi:hypothetical protein